MDQGALTELTTHQHGLFTYRQARACGFTGDQIRRRVARGDWRQTHAAVLALPGVRFTPSIRDRAAHLAVAGSVLCGPSAARFHGIPAPDRRTFLAVGRQSHPRVGGVEILRECVAEHDLTMIDGVLVTGRPRTVFDCLRLLDDADATALLDRALQQGWLTLDDLIARVRAHTGRGGAPRLVRMVRQAASGGHSAAEHAMISILRRSGAAGWHANHPVHDAHGLVGVVDIAFPAARLAIEIDGWAWHATPDRFARDRLRQNRLVCAGWTVLRFTWRDLSERPEHVVATVLDLLSGCGRF